MAVILSSVAGTPTAGQILTLSGSGFGTHANYNDGSYQWQGSTFLAHRFRDFETGVVNALGFEKQGDGTASITSTGGYGGGKYLACTAGVDRQVQYGTGTGSFGPTTVFACYWFRTSGTLAAADGKYWRHWWGTSDEEYYFSTGGSNWNMRGGNWQGDDYYGDGTNVWGTTTWQRFDVLTTRSDGMVQGWVNGSRHLNKSWYSGQTLRSSGHTLWVDTMVENAAGAHHLDDCYIDFTQARVELSDSSTWAGRWSSGKHCEIQIPVSWSTGAITVACNPGTLTGTLYAYVVDSAGLVNADGVAVSGGGTPPTGDITLLVR
jgi:hypothetical protein